MLTSRGIHLVLNQALCPEGIGLLLPSTDDGRVLFMLPFFGRTLVGTTDTPCSQTQACSHSQSEVSYLLNYVQRWFPALNNVEVGSCWAGGRPLLKPAGADVNSSRVVREHEVEQLPCGLVSVMGGKWTTCRPMANDTLQAVTTQLGRPLSAPQPHPLLGSAATPAKTRQRLREQAIELKDLLPDGALRDQQIAHLQSSHGLNAMPLITGIDPVLREPLSGVIPLCQGEIDHAIQREHARSASDVLARRCRMAMVDLTEARRLQPLVDERLDQLTGTAASTSPINHQLMP